MENWNYTKPPKNKGRLKTDEGNYKIQSPILSDESINPCLKEANLSNKCLYENNYDKSVCGDAFTNYTLCRRFWKSVEWKRWWNGITPSLPPIEEREQIRKEFIQELILDQKNQKGKRNKVHAE